MLQLLTVLQPPWSFGWWGVVCVSKWAACVADTPWYIINSCQTPGTGSSSSLLNVRLGVDPRHSTASSPMHALPSLSFLFLLLRLLVVQQQQQQHLWPCWCLHHRDFSLPLHHINQSVPAAHEWAKKKKKQQLPGSETETGAHLALVQQPFPVSGDRLEERLGLSSIWQLFSQEHKRSKTRSEVWRWFVRERGEIESWGFGKALQETAERRRR